MKTIAIINGPNLNMLGQREPGIYGKGTLSEINAHLEEVAKTLDILPVFFQSNHEGALLDYLHQSEADAAVLNAGAFTHYSYALRDAIAAVSFPVIEVHLSNTAARAENWRHTSVIAPVCAGSIAGFGSYSYELGLRAAVQRVTKD